MLFTSSTLPAGGSEDAVHWGGGAWTRPVPAQILEPGTRSRAQANPKKQEAQKYIDTFMGKPLNMFLVLLISWFCLLVVTDNC